MDELVVRPSESADVTDMAVLAAAALEALAASPSVGSGARRCGGGSCASEPRHPVHLPPGMLWLPLMGGGSWGSAQCDPGAAILTTS
jgi:hypothetical protein